MKTEAQKGGPAILDKVIGIVEALKEEADAGVCISTAGMVDIEKGEIFYSAPLIPNYIGTAFKKTVEERFGIPCEVENDVNCAGLAEYKAGAAAGSKAAVMLTIGTGIGGCILLNGEVFHGFSNSACGQFKWCLLCNCIISHLRLETSHFDRNRFMYCFMLLRQNVGS